MTYTAESLEQVAFADLREIGKLFGVGSTSSDGMRKKILEAQNGMPKPRAEDNPVDITGLEALTERKRNMEVAWGDDNEYFPALVPEDQVENITKALMSFANQWGIDKLEFFLKFQAFRIYIDGKHCDWIGLNEIIKRYELRIPLAPRTIARRLYTSPPKRAYR